MDIAQKNCQHPRATSPHASTQPSVHSYRQPPATACPLCLRQRLPQTALPCNPDHWVCLGGAGCLTHCPHCRDRNSHHCTRPAARAAPPPASHPGFFGPITDALRDHLGGHYVADAADHAWTIAMATGGAPLPPYSPPLRHSGGGLNVAARHILLTLYVHHCDLHLPDPQLPAPGAAAPAPEAWAETASEEVADYLRITCRRFNTALGRQKGSPHPLSALLYLAHLPHPTQLRPPGCWASFQEADPAAPSETTAARMDLADQRAHVTGLEACCGEALRWHTHSPSPPRGQGGSPAPDTHQGKKTKTGQGASLRARQQGTAYRPGPRPSHAARPHSTTPGAHQQHHHHRRPPPPPYRSTLIWQPGQGPLPAHVHAIQLPPFTQGQGAWHHQHHHHAPAIPDPYPLMPPYYSNPHQLHHHHAPAQPALTGHPPNAAPHRTAPSRVPRPHLPSAPTLTTVPTSAVVLHTANTPSASPPHSPAAATAPTARAYDIQATIRPHRLAAGHACAPTAPGPTRSNPSPPAAPPPATHAHKRHPSAATHCLRTTHPHLDTTASQRLQDPHGAHTQHPHHRAGRQDSRPAQHLAPPPRPPAVPAPHHPSPPPPPGLGH